MSSGPTMTGATCIEATRKSYINIGFDRSDWCSYSGGTCLIDNVITDKDALCMLCKHRVSIDVPAELDYYRKNEEENLCK